MKNNLIGVFLILQCGLNFSQTISPILMGQAFWNTTYSNVASPSTLTAWSEVKESGSTLIRIGGTGYNNSQSAKPPQFQEIYYVKIIDEVRSHGCEPVLTIPFELTGTVTSVGSSTYISAVSDATVKAQKMIRLINQVHKRNLKYVILANEPGTNYSGWGSESDANLADLIAEYTRKISIAVKEVDPSIKIIGPELEYYRTDVYNKLFATTNFTASTCIAEQYLERLRNFQPRR